MKEVAIVENERQNRTLVESNPLVLLATMTQSVYSHKKSMQLYFEQNQFLLKSLYDRYSENSKQLIPKIRQDRAVSEFDRFNKRFKLSWGMEIKFTDSLSITREDTRACYILMLKISDLWFAFEHLVQTACDVIPKDEDQNSKVNCYSKSTLERLGFDSITSSFNELLKSQVLHQAAWRREVYLLIQYLVNNTERGAQKLIADALQHLRESRELEAKHIFALAYGVRNIYVHKGVAAALGSKNYKVKRAFYLVMYDTLILYSLALGNAYCCKKLASYSSPIEQL